METLLRVTNVTTAGGYALPAGTVEFIPTNDGLIAINGGVGRVATFELGASGLRLKSSAPHNGPRESANVATDPGSLDRDVIVAIVEASKRGHTSAEQDFLSTKAIFNDACSVLFFDGRLYVAPANGAGLTSFSVGAQGRLSDRRVTSDRPDLPLSNIADMAVTSIGGVSYLYTVSPTENGLSGFMIGEDGALTPIAMATMLDGLPINKPSNIVTAAVDDQQFLVISSQGNSSLTVVALNETGHFEDGRFVLDTRHTRFGDVSHMESVVVDGRTYIAVAGSDDGVSLFVLGAGGHLIHLATLEDQLNTALKDISALSLTSDGRDLHIVTASASEPGLTHMVWRSINNTASGQSDLLSAAPSGDVLDARAGDDILIDGMGQDRLIGGPGADRFVFLSDGATDRIEDIQPGQDKIDLSSWSMLYSVDQLSISTRSYGAIISFRDEVLVLRTANGTRLDKNDIADMLIFPISQYPFAFDAIVISQPEPVPPRPPIPQVPPEPPADPAPPQDSDPAPPQDSDPAPPPPPPPEQSLPGTRGRYIKGTPGDDDLRGTGLDDTIVALEMNDRVLGLAGNDVLAGGSGDDTLNGGDGDDMIAASLGNDLVSGANGHDNIGGGLGNDTISGGAGNDTIGAGRGNDIVRGDIGREQMSGGAGNDTVLGGDGGDTMAGSYGNDTVRGEDGPDNMGGGHGNDVIDGGAGNDTIGAGLGDDTLIGGLASDYLGGSDGADSIIGGRGSDTLSGGRGNDILQGGFGADVFMFTRPDPGDRDVIVDFNPNADMIAFAPIPRFSYQQLSFQQQSDGVLISVGNHEIFVNGVTSDQLGPDVFSFIG